VRKAALVSVLAFLAASLIGGAEPAMAKLATPKPPTDKEQFQALSKKAEGGNVQAQYDLGQVYLTGKLDQKKNEKSAVNWISKAAEAGNAQAQFDLAGFYRLGRGVNPDFDQALNWYQKAADQGRNEASLFICTAYTQDATLHADWPKAFPYCKTAAADGAANAQYALGVAYAEGRGTAPDNTLALQNLKKAADQGQAAALTELGRIYQIGDLASQDYTEALILFKKAARRGDRAAIALTAQAYEMGQGTGVDLDRAARLYRILARDEDDKIGHDWLKAHPDAPKEPDALSLEQIPRDVIFYATETNDPRFQTMDIHGYFDQLSVSSYPGDAQNDNISGEAAGECRFTASGDFDDCVLVTESPKDYGFGASLMRIMDRLGSSGNKTDWAKRYEGKSVRISLKWKPK
jgi:TPR repeat protein